MADQLLQGRYPMRGLYQALAVAAMCLQEQAATRPLIGDVVTALSYLASQNYDLKAASAQSNRVGQSTPKDRDDRKNLSGRTDTQDEDKRGGQQGVVQSPNRNSPDFRRRELVHEMRMGAESGQVESGSGSGRKWGLDGLERQDSHRDSPVHAGKQREGLKSVNRDFDRERAVAEAKVWGENWRVRKRANARGSSDGTNDKL